MPATRWILLLLYVVLICGLCALGMWPDGNWVPPILLAVTVTAQALFILGAGRKDLCRPIRRPRLLFPVAAASFMLAVLVVALTWALSELFRFQDPELGQVVLWGTLGASWLVWGVVLFVYTRRLQRYQAIFRLAQLVFIGSLAELLAAVPAHIFVTKRGGCFAGVITGLGILAGLFVMAWSFGPAIFLLFLHEAQRRERPERPAGGERSNNGSLAPVLRGEGWGEGREARPGHLSGACSAVACAPSWEGEVPAEPQAGAGSAGASPFQSLQQLDLDPNTPPKRHPPFQYSLRTLLLMMLATSVISGTLRAFWGLWPAATFAGVAALVLLSCLLLARPWLPRVGVCLTLAGLVWVYWGDWSVLTVVVLPTGTFAILLVKQLVVFRDGRSGVSD